MDSSSPSSLSELDALLDDPARWPEVDPEKLRHLVFYRCLSYGLHPDESAIPSLMALHRVAVERLHPAVRRQVVVHLARAVERVHREHQIREGAGCTNALLPFLLEEPDPSVVSAAAVEMALLLPLEGGDPLTGPRYLRDLSDQVAGDDVRAGLVAGMLQLGDARVAPLVEGAWKRLGVEGRQTLALLVQGFHGLNGLTVQFLVSWLEDEVRDAASPTFGMVAATLARAGRHAGEHGVDEFDRVFPLAEAPESERSAPARHLSFDAYRLTVGDRLVRAGRAEVPPRLMPHVLSYWGLAEEAYSLAVAGGVAAFREEGRRVGAGGTPVRLELVPDWPEDGERETVLEWGIFNPIGPTINTLRVTPAGDAAALVYTLYHPGESASRVMAVLPHSKDAAVLGEAVRQTLAANGGHGVWLMRSLPDYVHVPPASGLDLADVAVGMAAAREAAQRAGDEPVDLGWHARRLLQLARDPWGTATAEIEGSGEGEEAGAGRPEALAEDEVPRPDAEAFLAWLRTAAAPRPRGVRAIPDPGRVGTTRSGAGRTVGGCQAGGQLAAGHHLLLAPGGRVQAFVKALAVVLAVPLICAALALHAQGELDARWRANLRRPFLVQRRMPDERLIARYSLAALCGDPRSAATIRPCRPYNLFSSMVTAAAATGAGGVLFLAGIAAAGAAARARRNRAARLFKPTLYATVSGLVVLVLAHGALGVAGVFLLGEVLQRWPLTLVMVLAAATIAAALSMVQVALAVTRRGTPSVAGRALSNEAQPRLVEWVGATAAAVGAAPPDHVVAGLRPALFVLEPPVVCLDGRLPGRVLYISLALARILSTEELRGLVAHELFHFSSGEVERTQQVVSVHAAARDSIRAMWGRASGIRGLTALPALSVLAVFMRAFEPAVAEVRRERELAADGAAARAVGTHVFASALVKAHVFAPAWDAVAGAIEQAAIDGTQYANASRLFAAVAAAGAGPERLAGIGSLSAPHPADVHPALAHRLAALGVAPAEVSLAALSTAPAQPAVALLEGYERIERELSEVEHRLAAAGAASVHAAESAGVEG